MSIGELSNRLLRCGLTAACGVVSALTLMSAAVLAETADRVANSVGERPVGALVAQAAPSAVVPRTSRADGMISEIRLGVMHHDAGVFGHSKEDDVDVNLEVLFAAPEFLRYVFSPRPHLGLTYAPDNDTASQIYFGLTWQYFFWRGAFAEGSLGGSLNDGSLSGTATEKALGCHLLFRESVSLGYVFEERHAVMATLDHISNANFCDFNEGLDTIGVRYGYRF